MSKDYYYQKPWKVEFVYPERGKSGSFEESVRIIYTSNLFSSWKSLLPNEVLFPEKQIKL